MSETRGRPHRPPLSSPRLPAEEEVFTEQLVRSKARGSSTNKRVTRPREPGGGQRCQVLRCVGERCRVRGQVCKADAVAGATGASGRCEVQAKPDTARELQGGACARQRDRPVRRPRAGLFVELQVYTLAPTLQGQDHGYSIASSTQEATLGLSFQQEGPGPQHGASPSSGLCPVLGRGLPPPFPADFLCEAPAPLPPAISAQRKPP